MKLKRIGPRGVEKVNISYVRGHVTKEILTLGLCSVSFGRILSIEAVKVKISVLPPQ